MSFDAARREPRGVSAPPPVLLATSAIRSLKKLPSAEQAEGLRRLHTFSTDIDDDSDAYRIPGHPDYHAAPIDGGLLAVYRKLTPEELIAQGFEDRETTGVLVVDLIPIGELAQLSGQADA